MEKIKKDYNLKLITILVSIIFVYTDLLYSYPDLERNYPLLRPPTMGDYNREEEIIKSRDSGNMPSNATLERRNFLSAVALPLIGPLFSNQKQSSDIIQNWTYGEDRVSLSLTINREMSIEELILRLAKDSRPHMEVKLTKSQIRILSALLKDQNPNIGEDKFIKERHISGCY